MTKNDRISADLNQPLYFEGLSKVAAKYPYSFWPTVGLVFLGFCLGFFSWTSEKGYLTICVPLVVGTAIVPWLIRMAYDDFLELREHAPTFLETSTSDPSEVRQWFANQLDVFTDRKVMHAVAGLSLLFGTVAYAQTEVLRAFDSWGYWFALIMAGIAGLFSGVAIFHLFLLARVIWRTGRFSVHVDSYDCGVLSIGNFMFKYWVGAAFIWLIYLLSWVTAPRTSTITFLLAMPSSVLIIASFIVSMVPLHRQMVRFKHRKIAEIKISLSKILNHGYEVSRDEREAVKFLEESAARIDALPEWPFRPSSLIGVTLSSFLTFLPSLMKLLVQSG